MSTPLKQVKYAALLACLAWALTLVMTTAAPAKGDHHDGPDAAQHSQDKAAKDAEKQQKEAAKDADRAQKEAEHAQKEAAKDAERAAKDAEKAQKKAEKEAKKGKKHKGDFIVVSAPSTAPAQQVMGTALRPCTSRRVITVKLRARRGVSFRSATFSLNGKRIATRHGKRPATILDLRGLAKGTYRLGIRAVTTKGKVLRGTRVYHTCVGPRPHRAPSL
jgi:hypothetical protein